MHCEKVQERINAQNALSSIFRVWKFHSINDGVAKKNFLDAFARKNCLKEVPSELLRQLEVAWNKYFGLTDSEDIYFIKEVWESFLPWAKSLFMEKVEVYFDWREKQRKVPNFDWLE